ncbi:hypothetical protein RO3G_11454 [Rhizopus delemar RA 99-880]|uniref:Uncharacterized protein n=1 Tax=Rhizopus delemar (strain RA 99-880 / ATCC MYA-4621 / FGSC 9543 / NRRL 43880) TaxID=246409 RepID=I1CE63_RHIO9|nr:hypothetical protein RO3G_11454 [Rhizopus delemar RA 99-880]|eukprot:EIE86743.1 hypothetical protein RO3G_11454 [Rhizopus delemar RA 99-880]
MGVPKPTDGFLLDTCSRLNLQVVSRSQRWQALEFPKGAIEKEESESRDVRSYSLFSAVDGVHMCYDPFDRSPHSCNPYFYIKKIQKWIQRSKGSRKKKNCQDSDGLALALINHDIRF